ncbi:unnamed protein product, partial [Mesorhabditis belari]|uniref:Peptidase metallopeptidase domain-containing protein n=1 Tax=Mesorhabditis belari TaxID=2138241 RepID=A0AAF3EML8_9BILA
MKVPKFRGKYCWNGECFVVSDLWRNTTDHRARVGALTFQGPIRTLSTQSFEGMIVFEMPLILPTDYIFDSLNSSGWRVNKSSLPMGYLTDIVQGIFWTGALELDKEVVGDVLVIGLGAGGVNNFLSTSFPNLNLTMVDINPSTKTMAIEQFEVIENGKTRIIIEDGVKYIDEQVKAGKSQLFDAIIVDACHNDFHHPIICPIDEFTSDGILGQIEKLLKQNGVLIVNVLTFDLIQQRETFDRVLNSHAKVFGERACTMKIVEDWENRVLFCSRSSRLTFEASPLKEITFHRWKINELTWSIGSYPSSLTKEQVRKSFANAFDAWSQISSFVFTEITRSDYADIKAALAVMAVTHFPPSGISLFNAKTKWVDTDPIGDIEMDLRREALHQIGHALGLKHSKDLSSIMHFSQYRHTEHEVKIEEIDVEALQKLYG